MKIEKTMSSCEHRRIADRLHMIRYSTDDGMTWRQGTVTVKRCLDCRITIKQEKKCQET